MVRKKKVLGFGQDDYFREDFDYSPVITVRVYRPENPTPCLFLQSGGLVFHPAVYMLQTGSVFHRKHNENHRKIKPA